MGAPKKVPPYFGKFPHQAQASEGLCGLNPFLAREHREKVRSKGLAVASAKDPRLGFWVLGFGLRVQAQHGVSQHAGTRGTSGICEDYIGIVGIPRLKEPMEAALNGGALVTPTL